MTITKPSAKPRWATDPTTPTFVTEPNETKKTEGWIVEKPPLNWFNWLLLKTYEWIHFFDNYTNQHLNDNASRRDSLLIGGGVWKFDKDAASGTLSWSDAFRVAIMGVTVTSVNSVAAGSMTGVVDGQAVYVDVNLPFPFKGNITNASPTVTNIDYIDGLVVGMGVRGTGIPVSTTITAITIDEEAGTHSITMSNNATATTSDLQIFAFSLASLTVAKANISDLILTPSRVVIARRHGDVCYLGCGVNPTAINDLELLKIHQTKDGFDAIVGNATNEKATHATIAAALAAVPEGSKIRVTENLSISSAITINKDNVTIEFDPGVTYTKSSGANALAVTADRVNIIGGRFSGYNGGSDAAIQFAVGADYGMVTRCRFNDCTQGVDNLSTTTEIFGNITE